MKKMVPKTSDTKTMIETSDMSKSMKEHAIKFVEPLILQQMSDDELALQLRETFDKHYGHGWNCIVGKDFSAYIQYEPRTMAFFYIPSGHTPLMIAAAHGNFQLLQLLVKNGADPLMKDESGKSAADYMTEYKQLHADDTVIESNENIIMECLGNMNVYSQNENVQTLSTSNTQETLAEKDTVNISDAGFEDHSGTFNDSVQQENITDDNVSVDIFDNESNSDDENQNGERKRAHSNTNLNEDEHISSSKKLKSDNNANSSAVGANENFATDFLSSFLSLMDKSF